jgi:hypothetical protein
MDDVQNCDSYNNIPLLQTYKSYKYTSVIITAHDFEQNV